MLLRFAFVLIAFAFISSKMMVQPSMAADPHPMQLEDLFRLARIADPQLNPKGSQIVYQVTKVSEAAKNAKSTQLWLLDINKSPRQITHSGKADSHPRWSPDGSKILFESNRSGVSQLFVLDIALGGEPAKVTSIATGASGGIWSPDGTKIAFYSAVNPKWSHLPFAESDSKNKEDEEAAAANPVKAKTFTRLFYRHWDSYVEDKRNHLFVANLDGSECRDVTPGDQDAYPTSTTFSVGDDFTFSPDSKSLVFTAVPKMGESWTTNYDICRVGIDNKSQEWTNLTAANPAADGCPKFSPDGKHVAFRTQIKPGYEADKWNLVLQPCNLDGTFAGKSTVLTGDLDRSVNDFAWTSASELVFSTDEFASSALYSVSATTKPTLIKLGLPDNRIGQITGISVQRDQMAIARATMNEPAELYLTSTKAYNKVDA